MVQGSIVQGSVFGQHPRPQQGLQLMMGTVISFADDSIKKKQHTIKKKAEKTT